MSMHSSGSVDLAWIGGKRFDLLFFFGSGAAAFAVGICVLLVPVTLVPLVWLWLWLIDGPHLLATWQRTYFDARERQTHARLLSISLLALPAAIALWALSAVTARPEPFDFLLLAATLLSWHHLLRQHYGIMAIYEAQTQAPPALWRFDRLFLQGSLWVAFFVSFLVTPANRDLLGLPTPLPLWVRALAMLGVAALLCALIAFVGSMVWRARRGCSLRPALFALLPVMGVACFSLFIVGAFEPVLSHPTNKEQIFLAVTLVGGIVHGLQYIGIVSAANRRRYESDTRSELTARLGRSPLAAYGALAMISVVYVLLNAARASMPGLTLLPENSEWARFFVAAYWGLFFHHYYLDRRIWHIRSDPRLKQELNLGAPAT